MKYFTFVRNILGYYHIKTLNTLILTTLLTNWCYLGRGVLLSFHWANPIQRFFMRAQWEERLQQRWISKINLSFLRKYKYQRLNP